MQLSKIILWPENKNLDIRIIQFVAGKVNYIIGDSDTGKSSIWPIIDYCLCSSELRVPVGPARDFASWFGIVLSQGEEEILIARQNSALKNEQTQKNRQSVYMLVEGSGIEIPASPRKNIDEASVEKLVAGKFNSFLNEIPRKLWDEHELQDKKIGKISFRDTLTLNHQMQYALLNPSSFIADSHYISILKLKKVLPLLLYSKETAYYRLKRGIQNKVQNEQKNFKGQLSNVNERMELLYREAFSLGLVETYMDPDVVKPDSDDLRKYLEGVLFSNAGLLAADAALNSEQLLVLGRIMECLEFAQIIDTVNRSDYELQIVTSDINSIEFDSRSNGIIDEELSGLSKLIKAYARKLRLEYLEYTPIFDEKAAILRFLTPVDQYVYLYQLGNTQSYVGYNIATFLSFHEFFLKREQNPIFPFLLIDHPGQAFSTGRKSDDEGRFRILSECLDFSVERLKKTFQLIILERTPPEQLLPNSVIVENWSNSSKKMLIPDSWKINS
ncbi:DUF3732 domain-containing protein [Chitinophaga filiformis]|uniref:DUF3732 domain-containing protein n=1 Tax=Chitinophaga filiformis TaxID=104663 RepID=A0A1G7YXG7_CHIFI|nr:DUF3732 domain-containing protein [Chitinophaga filiformis]SDH01087.1 Protein of unknown function [Chitinophaga filiformis]